MAYIPPASRGKGQGAAPPSGASQAEKEEAIKKGTIGKIERESGISREGEAAIKEQLAEEGRAGQYEKFKWKETKPEVEVAKAPPEVYYDTKTNRVIGYVPAGTREKFPERYKKVSPEGTIQGEAGRYYDIESKRVIGYVPPATREKYPDRYTPLKKEEPTPEPEPEQLTKLQKFTRKHMPDIELPSGSEMAAGYKEYGLLGLASSREELAEAGVPTKAEIYSDPTFQKYYKGDIQGSGLYQKAEDFQTRQLVKVSKYGEGLYTGIREQPERAAVSFGIGLAFGFGGKVVGAGFAAAAPYAPAAIGMTKVGIGFTTKALLGSYAIHTGKSIYAAEKQELGAGYKLAGTVTSTELLPFAAGAKGGTLLGKPFSRYALLKEVEAPYKVRERTFKIEERKGASPKDIARSLTIKEQALGFGTEYTATGGKIKAGGKTITRGQVQKEFSFAKDIIGETKAAYRAKKSPYRGKVDVPIEQVFTKPREAGTIRRLLKTSPKKVVFGSAAQKTEMSIEMERMIRDLDIGTRGKPRELATKAQTALGSKAYQVRGEKLVGGKPTHHVLDIHKLKQLGQFPFTKRYVKSKEGIRILQLQEQAARKGVGSLVPERAHKAKTDIADLLSIRAAQMKWEGTTPTKTITQIGLTAPKLGAGGVGSYYSYYKTPSYFKGVGGVSYLGTPTKTYTPPVPKYKKYAPYTPSKPPAYRPSKPPVYKPYTPRKPPAYKPPTYPKYRPSKPPVYKPSKPPVYKPSKPPVYKPPTYKPYTPSKPPAYKPYTPSKPPAYKPYTPSKPPAYPKYRPTPYLPYKTPKQPRYKFDLEPRKFKPKKKKRFTGYGELYTSIQAPKQFKEMVIGK